MRSIGEMEEEIKKKLLPNNDEFPFVFLEDGVKKSFEIGGRERGHLVEGG